MNRITQAVSDFSLRLATAIVLVALWLGLSAYLDAQPTETDALQASADDLRDAISTARAEAVATRTLPSTLESEQ